MSDDRPTVRIGVSAAATRLGVSVEAVRKRIHRGSLPAEKVDGRWMVLFPAPDAEPDVAPPRADSGQVAVRAAEPVDRTGDAQAQSDLVAALRSEIEFLRSELQARGEDVRRRDETIAELMHAIAAATSGRSGGWPPWKRRDK